MLNTKRPLGGVKPAHVFLVASFWFVFMLAAGVAQAAAPAALSCTISPTDASTDVGVPITFTADIQGGKGRKTVSWTFEEGTPSSSGQQSVDVTYIAEGEYVVSLDVSDKSGDSCQDEVTVIVSQAGGNLAPVAVDDGYGTSQGSPLGVVAPGVLNNDSDPDGDAITVHDPRTNSTTNQNGTVTLNSNGSFTYTPAPNFTGDDSFTYYATDGFLSSNVATVTVTVNPVGAQGPTARGDAYATPVYNADKDEPGLVVEATLVSGLLYNDFGGTPPLTAELVSGPMNGTLDLNPDGSFTYVPDAALGDNDNDSFVYRAVDSLGEVSADTTVNINILSDQTDFKILMNYELGMHCTGFEFAYCCVLPPYNSILAQVVKPNTIDPDTSADYARLLEGDHNNTDGLGRPVVMRDYELDNSGNFKKYFLEYFHDAQPRREGQGKAQAADTLISAVEGNSLFYHQTLYDSAEVDANGALVTGTYEGVDGVVLGDGNFNDPTDNYANGWLNHFYIYADLEGSNPNNSSLEADKIRLGVTGHIEYPADVGAALQPMGPTGSDPGKLLGGDLPAFDNVLTFSGDTGTVVYTQSKVLENLPIMLTSPQIWEALGLPLTPFEDSIDFFGDPGLVDEDSIRPYVAMKARLHEANCDADGLNCTQGSAVIGSNGQPVIGFGTAPIDIPNCERCHSVPADTAGQPNLNSPSYIRTDFNFPHGGAFSGASLQAITDAEYDFWNAYYDIVPGTDSDWYSRLKGAAINMLALHDYDQGTGFTANWPASTVIDPELNPEAQNTRLGKESVICQKCHADNVIAVVKSATKEGSLIKPISEALHWRHREITEGGSIDFADAAGRSGGCQGCHPAHRSDGVMDNYPITLGGDNAQADSDNRLAAGGCFVGRDVHSNTMKDLDGAETPEYLNAVGQWLSDNVFHNQDGVAGVAGHDTRGLWCTNCHTQLGQEIWKAENCTDLINGDCIEDIRSAADLDDLVSRINAVLGTSYDTQDAVNWLDPKDPSVSPLNQEVAVTADLTHAIWDAAIADANVATIEVRNGQAFGTTDTDGDFSVRILDFCTTPDCVSAAQTVLDGEGNNGQAVAVPFSAATDGRDHWLSPGEPHCADCHAAPYVEQSGNINPYPPFNYPRKASLMRYSKGHQGISCQGCHESIHGLYPVTPTIDSTSYAQAAALNHDGSHGPLKCGACHQVNGAGVPSHIEDGLTYNGQPIKEDYDAAVSWMHTFTANADPRDDYCLTCHEDNSALISSSNKTWAEHAFKGRSSREMMDMAELVNNGHVGGDPAVEDPANTVCKSCHGDRSQALERRGCTTKWKNHLVQGRSSEVAWEEMSQRHTASTCGW